MHSNLLMYLTAMSAVSIHNLANNIKEATKSYDSVDLRTLNTTNWNLGDENKLALAFPQCNGTNQSPINIETSRVRENLNLRLGLTAYDKPISGFLANQFPTFRLIPFSFEWPRPSALVSQTIARSFNPYADSHFALNYIQFHWSHDWSNSSLHRVDNVGYPIEIHFVHTNTAYTNLEEALTRPDGLLILAVMVVPSTHESYLFDRILDNLINITNHGQQVNFDEDSTWRSLLPLDTSRFYRYHGSLVMPPCHESVQWIIFDEKLKLGQRQLKRLKRYRFMGKDLKSNLEIDWSIQKRSIRHINNRTVERSFRLRLERGQTGRTNINN